MFKPLAKTRMLLVIGLTLTAVALGLLNLLERTKLTPLPDDGVTWIDTRFGVVAETVRAGSAADRAGLVRGDRLRYVNFEKDGDQFYKIDQARDIFFILDEKVGINGSVTYTIERIARDGSSELWDGILTNIEPEPTRLPLQLYLACVGFIFLLVGLYVLSKQHGGHYTIHFNLICLLVFITYSYSHTGEFTFIDKIVYLADTIAFLLLAPLFFHFCLIFPFRREFIARHSWASMLIYTPAIIMISARVVMLVFSSGDNGLLRWDNFLKKAEIFQFFLSLCASTAILVLTFMQTRASMLRQQLKWIVWGLSLNALPFTIFYVYPYLMGQEISQLQAGLATGPSILLPISFGYSLVRYRLMDVDIIVRRSMTYALATISIVVIFMLGVVKAGEWVKELVPSASQGATLLIQVSVMSMAAMLFSPIKNWLGERVDRLFFGERYDYRRGLADFGRTLSTTTELDDLLGALARRLGEMFTVHRIAIFVEDEMSYNGFRLAYRNEIPHEPVLPADFAAIMRKSQTGRGYVAAEEIEGSDIDPNRRLVHYYIPCYVRDRLIAVIGLGKTIEGAMLTSEDINLVRGLSGYVAVAIENSLLYRSEKEKAQALARLKDFSENIIESINIGLLAIDREGRITNWNSALEELLSIARDEAIGRHVREVFEEDLLNTIHSATGEKSWEIGEVHNIYRYKINSRDGRELIVNISLSPLEAKDARLAGALMLLEDITMRVRLEEQMRETDKLSSIGLLAAGVAHEVNTPLTGISSYTQMLLQQIPAGDPKMTVLEKIKRQALRASDIVNNLLNFSRTGNVEFAELDVNKVLDDTIQLLEPQLRNTQIKIERHFSEGLPKTIGNATKLQQVFMNLIINARDAMPQGGVLNIRTQARDAVLLIDVSDTGVGIAPENIAKIYDPFFTTKGVGQGTGLGLAVSYGIIQEHKGRIFVESKPGMGTRFRIKLPTVSQRIPVQAIAGD